MNVAELIMISQVAKAVGVSHYAVRRRLKRLDISPAMTAGMTQLYHPDVLDRVRESFRKPAGQDKQAQNHSD